MPAAAAERCSDVKILRAIEKRGPVANRGRERTRSTYFARPGGFCRRGPKLGSGGAGERVRNLHIWPGGAEA